MTYEKSCGAIVYKVVDGKRYYLLVQQKEGFWAFPKGHIEKGEAEEECARREVEEETGLLLWAFRDDFREVDEHPIPGTDRTKKIVYFLGEAITVFDGSNQEPEFQKEELQDARFVTLEEAEKLMPYEDRYNKPRIKMLRKADALLEAEKKDKEFCRSADKVLVELKKLAVRDGMECRQKESDSSKGHVILRIGELVVECTNFQHYIEIEVMPEDLKCAERFYDVVGYYSVISEKYPEDDMCISIDNSCSVSFDNPGLAVEIPYEDVFPTAEELKIVMDSLIAKMDIYEPVIRAIAAGRPVPRDESEASRFYYNVYLKSEQYKRLKQFAEE